MNSSPLKSETNCDTIPRRTEPSAKETDYKLWRSLKAAQEALDRKWGFSKAAQKRAKFE